MSVQSIITDYESLGELKTIRGRAVRIKNPKNCGIGGAWVEGFGDVDASGFNIPVRGRTLINSGIKDGIDPDFSYEYFSFGYPAKNVVLDKKSSEAIRALCEETHNRRIAAARENKPQKEKPMLRIYLSSRGWGDYSPLVWEGCADTPNETILAECKKLFETGYDVDAVYDENKVKSLIVEEKEKQEKAEAEHAEAKKRAEAVIAATPEKIVNLAKACGYNPENLADDIDHPHYWAVRAYIEALNT